jgi:triosephosphate isomerase
MEKRKIKAPFLILNVKSYIYGEELLNLAKETAALADTYDLDVVFTAPYVDLPAVAALKNPHLFVTAQHMDGIVPGRGMGAVLPESLKNVGVDAVILNHAEKPMELAAIDAAMRRADELGMNTIVIADTPAQSRAAASLGPDMMICEPTSLIGTGTTSNDDYIIATNEAVRSVDPDIMIIQAAGVSSGADVYRVCKLGANASGGTSGILKAPSPKGMVEEMMQALAKVRDEAK